MRKLVITLVSELGIFLLSRRMQRHQGEASRDPEPPDGGQGNPQVNTAGKKSHVKARSKQHMAVDQSNDGPKAEANVPSNPKMSRRKRFKMPVVIELTALDDAVLGATQAAPDATAQLQVRVEQLGSIVESQGSQIAELRSALSAAHLELAAAKSKVISDKATLENLETALENANLRLAEHAKLSALAESARQASEHNKSRAMTLLKEEQQKTIRLTELLASSNKMPNLPPDAPQIGEHDANIRTASAYCTEHHGQLRRQNETAQEVQAELKALQAELKALKAQQAEQATAAMEEDFEEQMAPEDDEVRKDRKNRSLVRIATPAKFSGERGQVVEEVLVCFEEYLKAGNVSPDQWVSHAMMLLEGKANAIWLGYFARKRAASEPVMWTDFTNLMKQSFAHHDRALSARSSLHSLSQRGSVIEYVRNTRALLAKAGDMSEPDLLLHFYNGLKPQMRDKSLVNPKTGGWWQSFDQLADHVITVETATQRSQHDPHVAAVNGDLDANTALEKAVLASLGKVLAHLSPTGDDASSGRHAGGAGPSGAYAAAAASPAKHQKTGQPGGRSGGQSAGGRGGRGRGGQQEWQRVPFVFNKCTQCGQLVTEQHNAMTCRAPAAIRDAWIASAEGNAYMEQVRARQASRKNKNWS